MRKNSITLYLLFMFFNYNSQTNIIPNGNFENSTTTNTNSCFNAFFKDNNGAFNTIVNNWKVAKHSNSGSSNNYVGLVSFIDVSLCSSGDVNQGAFCGNTYPNFNQSYFLTPGNQKLIKLRADYKNCKYNYY